MPRSRQYDIYPLCNVAGATATGVDHPIGQDLGRHEQQTSQRSTIYSFPQKPAAPDSRIKSDRQATTSHICLDKSKGKHFKPKLESSEKG